ncbi:MAG: hypothetical protein ACRDO2_11990, partial [Nocardioidaceae bacterium]
LYACLTARWPGDEATGLPSAPTEHGRVLRPRQVRAGVPRPLDAVCDRILSKGSKYGDRIASVAEVREALTSILTDDGYNLATGGHVEPQPTPDTPSAQVPVTFTPPPALLNGDSETPPPQPVYTGPPSSGQTSPLGRTLLWSVIAVLLAGAVLLAYMVGQHGAQSAPEDEAPSDATPSQSGPVALQQVSIEDAQDFDPPPGSGDENPELVDLAIDDDPGSAWETLRYDNNPELGGIKEGVGLVLDLGQATDVSEVAATLQGEGTTIELRVAPESAATAPSGSADDYRLVDEVIDAGSTATFTLDKPVRTRYLLLWLTKLPPETSSTFRGRVADVEVRG